MKLTDLLIQRLEAPKKGSKTYFDDNPKGFGVRVSAGGTKSFTLVRGKARRRTAIGKYPVVSLQEARSAAKRLLAEQTLGRNQRPSVEANLALQAYLARAQDRLRSKTYYEYARILNSCFLPAFKHERLDKITTRALLDRIDKLRSVPAQQNHTFAVFKIFLTWCVRNHYLERSPLELMQAPNSLRARDRVLSAVELRAIWNSATGTYGTIAKLLILTGQRRGEIAGLQAHWVNRTEKTITLPAEATKNKSAHTFPYGDMTAKLLPEGEGFLFPAERTHVRGIPSTCFNGWAKPKIELDKAARVTGWTLHDLRRTFTTNLAELGIEPHIIEALINHKSGVISGVAATYNRARYMRPMRNAVGMWETQLKRLLRSSDQSHSDLEAPTSPAS